MADILVLGATGITGRQTIRYLAGHPERAQFTLAIAGRSRKKLGTHAIRCALFLCDAQLSLYTDELVSSLSLPNSILVHVADVTNSDQLEALVKNSKVVLNCVGPYVKWGPPVVW